MGNTLHLPGDRTEDLAAMTVDKSTALFGPDICGPRVSDEDLANAVRMGDRYTMDLAKQLPQGARYELVEAEYDFAKDVTVARFRPFIDPRQRLRYHGGGELNPEDDEIRRLTDEDDITAR